MQPKLSQSYPNPVGRNRGAPLDIHDGGSVSPFVIPPELIAPASNQKEITEQTHPIFTPGFYGDAQLQLIVFPGAGSQLVLPRPSQYQRTLLIITNDIAGVNIRVNFDTPASVTVGLPIPPGGNLFMDNVVAQNDVWVFAPAAGNVQVAWMNIDVTNTKRLA